MVMGVRAMMKGRHVPAGVATPTRPDRAIRQRNTPASPRSREPVDPEGGPRDDRRHGPHERGLQLRHDLIA
jgi:hypothetical protein